MKVNNPNYEEIASWISQQKTLKLINIKLLTYLCYAWTLAKYNQPQQKTNFKKLFRGKLCTSPDHVYNPQFSHKYKNDNNNKIWTSKVKINLNPELENFLNNILNMYKNYTTQELYIANQDNAFKETRQYATNPLAKCKKQLNNQTIFNEYFPKLKILTQNQ